MSSDEAQAASSGVMPPPPAADTVAESAAVTPVGDVPSLCVGVASSSIGDDAPLSAAPEVARSLVRPKSAFLYFMAAHRAKIKAAFPELAYAQPPPASSTAQPAAAAAAIPTPALVASASATFSELARLIGWEWRQLTPEQRAPYEQLSAQDKARYKSELEALGPSAGGDAQRGKKKRATGGGDDQASTSRKKSRAVPTDNVAMSSI